MGELTCRHALHVVSHEVGDVPVDDCDVLVGKLLILEWRDPLDHDRVIAGAVLQREAELAVTEEDELIAAASVDRLAYGRFDRGEVGIANGHVRPESTQARLSLVDAVHSSPGTCLRRAMTKSPPTKCRYAITVERTSQATKSVSRKCTLDFGRHVYAPSRVSRERKQVCR